MKPLSPFFFLFFARAAVNLKFPFWRIGRNCPVSHPFGFKASWFPLFCSLWRPWRDSFELHTRPLVRESAPQEEEQSNCLTTERKRKNLLMGPRGLHDTKTDWPTYCLFQYQENKQSMGTGSNTSTLTPWVVEDENEPSAWGYKWALLFLENITKRM
jgi:hypothetical protein